MGQCQRKHCLVDLYTIRKCSCTLWDCSQGYSGNLNYPASTSILGSSYHFFIPPVVSNTSRIFWHPLPPRQHVTWHLKFSHSPFLVETRWILRSFKAGIRFLGAWGAPWIPGTWPWHWKWMEKFESSPCTSISRGYGSCCCRCCCPCLPTKQKGTVSKACYNPPPDHPTKLRREAHDGGGILFRHVAAKFGPDLLHQRLKNSDSPEGSGGSLPTVMRFYVVIWCFFSNPSYWTCP